MKKIKLVALALGLCAAVSLFAGCNNTTDESAEVSRIGGGQTKINVDNGGSNKPSAGGYKFTYKGYEIVQGEKLGKYLEFLGEPEKRLFGASCAYQGSDLEYYYPGFVIRCVLDNDDDPDGEAIIVNIEINDPLIDCKGIHVGQTLTDAKAVFGTPDQEDDYGIIYRSEDTVLQISSNEVGDIVSITFRSSDD